MTSSCSFEAPRVGHVPSSLRSSPSSSVLRHWRDPSCYLVQWERRFARPLVSRLDNLRYEELVRTRFTATPEKAAQELDAGLATSRWCDRALGVAVNHDMARLVALFASATAARELEVSIEALRGDPYRLFYADLEPPRLVTTYVGPGINWISPERARTASGLQSHLRAPVQEMPRFAVGIFTGSGPSGLVYRSPHLSSPNDYRLVFSLNRPYSRPVALHWAAVFATEGTTSL